MTLAHRLSRYLLAVAYLASICAGALHHHAHSHGGCCDEIVGDRGHDRLSAQRGLADEPGYCQCKYDHLGRAPEHSHGLCHSSTRSGSDRSDHDGQRDHKGQHDDCSICRSLGQLPLPVAHCVLQLTPELIELANEHCAISTAAPSIRSHHSRAPPTLG